MSCVYHCYNVIVLASSFFNARDRKAKDLFFKGLPRLVSNDDIIYGAATYYRSVVGFGSSLTNYKELTTSHC